MLGVDIEKFLAELDQKVLDQVKIESVPEYSGLDFQKLVLNVAKSFSQEYGIDPNEIKGTGPGDFPDIVLKGTLGIEVKVTKDDNWISLGNSINESRRVPGVQDVYIIFGKMGGQRAVRHRKYETALSAIKSTHYPRYVVDMGLPEGESIFERLGISYASFIELDGIERIRKLKGYLRETLPEGEVLWWMDSNEFPQKGQLSDGTLRNLNLLSIEEKNRFRQLSMLLTPQIFGSSPTKYNRSALLLAKEFRAVTGNLRDFFSAGGRVEIQVDNSSSTEVPKMVYWLWSEAKVIDKLLKELSGELLDEYWPEGSNTIDRTLTFSALLDAHSNFLHGEITLGDLYRSRLS